MLRTIFGLLLILSGPFFICDYSFAAQTLKMTRSYKWAKFVPSAGQVLIETGAPPTPIEVNLDATGQGIWSEGISRGGVTFMIQINVQKNSSTGLFDVAASVYTPDIFSVSEAAVFFHVKNFSKLIAFDLRPAFAKGSQAGFAPIVTFAPSK